jgi:hypothetical protein
MGYTLSLHLKEGAPVEQIVSFLENSPTVKENPSVRVSSKPDEHGYANVSPSGYGVYISYSSLMTVESYLIHALIHLAAVQYGLRTKHHKVKMSVPYYMYDDNLVFVLSENELSKLSPEQYQYKMYNDVVKKRYVVPTEPEDDRQYAYFETSKYNESPKMDNLGMVLKIIKFLGGEFKRLKVAEQEFKAIKSTLLEKYPSRTKPTEIY